MCNLYTMTATVDEMRRVVGAFCKWTAEPDPETKRKRKVWFGMQEDHEPLFAFAGLCDQGRAGRSWRF